ncbi:RmlC-like cupin domain-containing protein [Obelidium mucronatum]|nr:RmlC-like cupin domain-containing protein [Obelidium mucronatum]
MARFTIRSVAVPAPMPTLDPFLFAVYHADHYPPGDAHMQAPRRGTGADFDAAQKYRMYHGARVPGFPQHPHRGFETVTCTLQGAVDHTDSLGGAGRYGGGDVQWMTAGRGIVHGEMIPLLNQNADNPVRWFQLWLNLPAKSKMTAPNQLMHWAENIARFTSSDGKVNARVLAGSLHGTTALTPTKDSWANDPAHDVNIWYLVMKPGATFKLPKSAPGSNRTLYFVEGTGLTLDKTTKVPDSSMVEFKDHSTNEIELENTGSEKDLEILVLQGQPIGEPVAQHGPFVMNTQEEIRQAFADYRKTQFGGWPWPQDAMVFPREKGRFLSVKGKPDEFPPSSSSSSSEKGSEL